MNILSKRSSIPPWLLNKEEKSFIFKCLFIYEKNISPINKDIAKNIEIIKLKFKKYITVVVAKKDTKVPDHVLLGLILGTIVGPPRNLPEI